ncbi:unnamed protein product [Camellia sinensis]
MPRTFWDCPKLHCLYPRKRSPDPRKILRENLMAFRVYALTGGLASLMRSIDVAQLKRCTQSENEKKSEL